MKSENPIKTFSFSPSRSIQQFTTLTGSLILLLLNIEEERKKDHQRKMALGERGGWDKSESRYCGVETDFNDDMPHLLSFNLSSGGFDFVVASLVRSFFYSSPLLLFLAIRLCFLFFF